MSVLCQLLRQLTYNNSNYSKACGAHILTAPTATTLRYKSTANLDYSRYPKLNEDELEETFTRGSGPGGQAVNKTSNCVFLRHIPTNITIKCHKHRIASRNRDEARKLLLEKLDVHLNGEHSIEAQLKVLEQKKSTERKRRQQKLQELKKNWKERESENE